MASTKDFFTLMRQRMSYHGVANNKDGKVRVAGLHKVDVLQGVSDVNLKIFDVHPFPFTLTMTNCEEHKEVCSGLMKADIQGKGHDKNNNNKKENRSSSKQQPIPNVVVH